MRAALINSRVAAGGRRHGVRTGVIGALQSQALSREPKSKEITCVVSAFGKEFHELGQTHTVDTSSIDLSLGPEGERGIFAARSVSEGDTLLRIPHSLLLRSSSLTSASTGDVSLDGHEKLAAQLLLARLGAEGKVQARETVRFWLEQTCACLALDEVAIPGIWEAYSIDYVPSLHEQTSLVFFHPDELAQLQDSRLTRLVSQLYGPAVLPDFGLEDKSWGRWAIGSVHSRVFSCFNKADIMLAPFADMLNHSEENNCCFRPNIPLAQYVPSSDKFEVVAEKDISLGEELTISYGMKERWEMMLSYGFTPQQSSADKIDMKKYGLEPINKAGLFRSLVKARYSGLDSNHLAAAANSLPLTDSNLSRREDASRAQAIQMKVLAKILYKGDEISAVEMLELYPTMVEDDRLILGNVEEKLKTIQDDSSLGSGRRLAAALLYRMQRKQVLEAAIELMSLHMENLAICTD